MNTHLKTLVSFLLFAACACGDVATEPTEEVAMPYDITDGSSSTRFTDGQTPIAAQFLNNCVVEFESQHDAIVSKDVPGLACVAEVDYGVAPGAVVAEAVRGSATFLLGVSLESTGGRLVLATVNGGTVIKTLQIIDRSTLAQVDEQSWDSGFSLDGYDALATDGERAWITGTNSVQVQGYATDDVGAGAAVSLTLPYEVRSLSTNGPHLGVASSEGVSTNYVFRAYNRTGGAQLWSISNPWTAVSGLNQPEIAVDGRAAYLMQGEDSTGSKLRVRAVNIETGATLWTFSPAYEYADSVANGVRQRIASNGELVAVVLSKRVVVVNAYTGVELWNATYTDPPAYGTNPAGLSVAWGADGRLYVGRAKAATQNGVYVYDGVTGRLIWSATNIAPLALVQDGAGLFAAYASGADLRVARLGWGYSGPLLMQRVDAATGRYRRPAARAIVPVYGMR